MYLRAGAGSVAVAGSSLPHGCEPVEGRGLRALDEAVEGLHGLQLRHHLVQQPLWS